MSAPTLRAAVAGLPVYVPGERAASALTAALASNESHFDPLPSVLDTLAAASRRVNRYPDMQSAELRAVLADGLSVTPDEVAVGPGSAGVLRQAITSLCDPGDEVVHAWRSFEAYPVLVEIAGARGVPVPLRADETHDLPAMAAAVTDRTRMVIVCSPNNPTGAVVDHAALTAFLRRTPPRVLVVVDEAYIDYADPGRAADAPALLHEHPNLCILRTFSKAHGLAGLRIGYAVSSAPVARALRATATPFAVSALAQAAALASLRARDELRERVRYVVDERRRVGDAARRAGWSVPVSDANFVWLPSTPALQVELLDALSAADILVRSYPPPHPGVRITLADRGANDRVLEVLADRRRFGPQR